MAGDEWIGQSEQNDTSWTDVADGSGTVARLVDSYRQLVVTFLVTTAPTSGEVAVRIMQSADYGLDSRSTKHWSELFTFPGVHAGSSDTEKCVTQAFDAFHGYIKIQSKCTEADQTVVFNVDIEGKT